MKRITPGTVVENLNGTFVVPEKTMLRGQVQQKPRRRFQAILSIVGHPKTAVRLMTELELWAIDDDGVMDTPTPDWIIRYADEVIDGVVEPSQDDLKAMRKILDGYRASRMDEAVSSATRLSLALDEKAMNGQATTLDAKYAGDKLGWLYRADPPAVKQQTMSVGKLTINAGPRPASGKKPPRIDKKDTKRLATVIDAVATEVR